MSQLTHPITTFRSHWIVVSAALLALAATAAVVQVLALGRSSSESNDTPVTPNTSPPDVRYDGGPEEGRSFSIQQPGVRYDGGPDEGLSRNRSGRWSLRSGLLRGRRSDVATRRLRDSLAPVSIARHSGSDPASAPSGGRGTTRPGRKRPVAALTVLRAGRRTPMGSRPACATWRSARPRRSRPPR
jgi:hypothetical protein